MLFWTSPLTAAAGAASLCGSLFWSEDWSGFFWSVLGRVSGALAGLLLSCGTAEGCWLVLDGWLASEDEPGAVLCEFCGILCATAKPLPSATINASLWKCCFTIILRFLKLSRPLGNRYAYYQGFDEARVIRATNDRYGRLDAWLHDELAQSRRNRELLNTLIFFLFRIKFFRRRFHMKDYL